MRSVYNDPDYAEVQEAMHRKLEEIRAYYGDSDDNNETFRKAYLEFLEE